MIAHTREDVDETPVSLGYDRIRFLAPVYFGDTITVEYRIGAIDPERRRSTEGYHHYQPGRHVGCGSHAHSEMGQERLTCGRADVLVYRFIKECTLCGQVKIAPPKHDGGRIRLCNATQESRFEFVF
jgi:hypothetical protein